MKMSKHRIIVTLAVDILVPEGGTLDMQEVGNSVERRVRVMRAHTSKRDEMIVDGKVNPTYFEVDRVWLAEPAPVEVVPAEKVG